MNEVVDGVIIPPEMRNASIEHKREYAATTKAMNSRVVKAVLDLEEHIERTFGPDEAARILDRG